MTGVEPGAPEQEALFKIEVDEEDGCVWICSPEGRDIWCRNLGPIEAVAQQWAGWLAQRDFGE